LLADSLVCFQKDLVIERFNQLLATYQDKVPKEIIRKFVSENFQGPGDELDSWVPKDWRET
jgi:hypothetical protein